MGMRVVSLIQGVEPWPVAGDTTLVPSYLHVVCWAVPWVTAIVSSQLRPLVHDLAAPLWLMTILRRIIGRKRAFSPCLGPQPPVCLEGLIQNDYPGLLHLTLDRQSRREVGSGPLRAGLG